MTDERQTAEWDDWDTTLAEMERRCANGVNPSDLAEVIISAFFEFRRNNVIPRAEHTPLINRDLSRIPENTQSSDGAEDVNASLSQNGMLEREVELPIADPGLACAQTDPASSLKVVRPVPVCETKHFERNRIAWLSPGSVVQVVERAGKWMQVSAQVAKGKIVSGWALKKYFSRL